ncbi:hypothetical protein F7725_013068 [Dissostichus mawsoni]|uniref:Mitochondrial ribosomal protein S36 n=1 Tax=Dissostichus mawsoni TaxID=36200 RepID=A0A7J5YP65_DISMA|nr:hypothetical protein F7725_013068 [Dissostichus mawsoni]
MYTGSITVRSSWGAKSAPKWQLRPLELSRLFGLTHLSSSSPTDKNSKANVVEVLKTLVVNTSPHKAPAPPPIPRPHVPLTPISGTADTLASIQLLPARYRRRPMTVEEMDYIQRGGPE